MTIIVEDPDAVVKNRTNQVVIEKGKLLLSYELTPRPQEAKTCMLLLIRDHRPCLMKRWMSVSLVAMNLYNCKTQKNVIFISQSVPMPMNAFAPAIDPNKPHIS